MYIMFLYDDNKQNHMNIVCNKLLSKLTTYTDVVSEDIVFATRPY